MPRGVTVRLLGEFRVVVDDRIISANAWDHRRAADLVKLLALSPDHRRTRDEVLEMLCRDLEPEAGAAALHKAASIARRVLGDPDAIVLRGGDVALAPDAEIRTDVRELEDAARRALASGDRDACARAATLYAGELLPSDRYSDWVAPHRERLAARHLELLRKAGAWEEVVTIEPLDESAHVALMRLYASVGNRTAALRQFRTLRKVLADDLGVTPSPEAVALYEEIARGPAVHAPVTAIATIEGREVELTRARALLRKVASGRGHTLLVRGDGGIGKTLFCETVLLEAMAAGATTLRGTAHMDGPASYAPVVEALDRLLFERPDLAASLTETARQVLARLGAGVASPGSAGEQPISRQRILLAITQLVTLVARERPVVLFLDDLHQADESTIELVHYLAEQARFHRVLLLAAFRPDHPAAFQRVRGALLAQRAATEIELAGLSRDECGRLLERVTGKPPSADTLQAIHDRAAGNPLFTEMLAGAITEVGDIEIPGDLLLVVEGFLARAGEPAVAMLERVAVLGDTFTAEEALAVVGGSEEIVYARLDESLRARVVDEVAGGYRFHHALLRETLVRRLPAHRRREVHRAAARALADTHAPAARVARHLLEAGDGAEAAPWFAQAASEEANVSAYRSALALLDLALTYGPRTFDLLVLRGDLLTATGDPAAPAAYAEAGEAADETKRSVLSLLKARAHIALHDFESAARELAGVEPPTETQHRVRFLVTRATLDWIGGDLASAEAAAAEARTLATESAMGSELLEAVVMTDLVAHTRGEFPNALRNDLFGSQGASVERTPVIARAIQDGHVCVSESWLYGGEPYTEIARFAREIYDTGEKSGTRRAVAFASCLLGETKLLTGQLEEAETHLEEAARVSQEVRSLCTAALSLQRRAEAALAAGARDRANALLDRAIAIARESDLGQRHILQRIYGTRIAAAASPEEALAVVDEAEVAMVGPGEGCTGCHIPFAIPAAIACARAGDLDRARKHLEHAARLAQMFWRGGAWHAAVEEARGELAAKEGRAADARAHFAAAEQKFADISQRPDADRCRRAREALV